MLTFNTITVQILLTIQFFLFFLENVADVILALSSQRLLWI